MFANVLQLVLAAAVVPPAEASVRVACPVGAVTRIVLPEALQQLQTTRDARRALGVSVERTRPQGVLRVEPSAAGTAVVKLRGTTLRVRLTLETVAGGAGSDLRLARDGSLLAPVAPAEASRAPVPNAPPAPVDPAPAATPPSDAAGAPRAAQAEPASASETPPFAPRGVDVAPAPSEPPPAAAPAVVFDLSNLMRAAPVPIGRREGLPGQQPMVLVDALRGDTHLWLRFTLQEGAAARVRSVAWEAGPIETYTQEPVGRDLRIVVQLPRESVTRKTRVVLAMESGGEYRFALSSGTLTDLWRKLFN